MNRSEFVSSVAEAFDMAKAIVHQRHRATASEFRHRVQRLGIVATLGKCEHWTDWPTSPTTFGQYQRAGDSALHVAYQFARAVNAAVQVAKVNAVGMPSDLATLTESDWLAWMGATKIELETTTLDLSQWSAAELMRDADLILRKIRTESEQGGNRTAPDWREHNAADAMEWLGIESRTTLGDHARDDKYPYLEKIRRGCYRINHSHPSAKGKSGK